MANRIGRETTSVNRADLHIALLPQEAWIQKLNYASFQSISEAVSLGFIRIDPEISLASIRHEISRQVFFDEAFTFLRHVGRALVVVSRKQETEMKGKHYLPPHSTTYEILLLPGGDHLYINNTTQSLTSINQKQPPPKKPRETTFQAVERVVQRLINDSLISERLGSQLLDESARNPVFCQTLKYLDEAGLLEDIMRFFEDDQSRWDFLKWVSEHSNLDRYIKHMASDPFSAIKDYYLQKGTFVDFDDNVNDSEEVRKLKDKHRRYVWGNATVKKPLNTVSTQTGQSRLSSRQMSAGSLSQRHRDSPVRTVDSRLSKSADSRLQYREDNLPQNHHHENSKSLERDDVMLTSVENEDVKSSEKLDRRNEHKLTNGSSAVGSNSLQSELSHSENSDDEQQKLAQLEDRFDGIRSTSKNEAKADKSRAATQSQKRTEQSRNNFRSHEDVQRLGAVRRERKQAEDRRIKVVEQERSTKEDIAKSEDRRNQLLRLIQLELEREKRLEQEREFSKTNARNRRQNPSASHDLLLQSHKDRATQLSAAIQNTKSIISETKIRLDKETQSRQKIEADLRRVRSEMTRAKIQKSRNYRNKRKE